MKRVLLATATLALALLFSGTANAYHKVLVYSTCKNTIRFLLHHNLGGPNWATTGWHFIRSGGDETVKNRGTPVYHDTRHTLYVYAEEVDRNGKVVATLKDPKTSYVFEGRSYGFARSEDVGGGTDREGNANISFSCD